jgi:phage terminase small subunit
VLYRRLTALIRTAERAVVDLAQLARNLGLRPSVSRNASMVKSLRRLEAFGLAGWRPKATTRCDGRCRH